MRRLCPSGKMRTPPLRARSCAPGRVAKLDVRRPERTMRRTTGLRMVRNLPTTAAACCRSAAEQRTKFPERRG
jgi:hypothetical protein